MKNLKIYHKIPALCFCLFVMFSNSSVPAQNRTAAISQQALASNQPLERAIKGGETHTYQIKLAARQFLRLEVVQPSAYVEVKFFAPNGKEINAVFNIGAFAAAYLSYEAEQAGEYRLEIAADETIAPNAKYVVKSQISERATNNERTRMTAERLLIEIGKLADTDEKESLEKANEKSGQALVMWRKLGA